MPRRLFIILSVVVSSSSILFISTGLNEKKAISEAEIKPEINNNNKEQTKEMTAAKLGVCNVIPVINCK